MVRIWNIESRKETRLKAKFPTAVAFSPDGNFLAVGSGSLLADRATAHGETTIWNWQDEQPQFELPGHIQFVRGIFYCEGGTRIWSVGFDGAARLWDLKTRYEILKLDGDFRYGFSAAVSADGNKIVVGTEAGQAILWDAGDRN
jgi:eukaryotic-like serine/threonine-protein kinase